jgi:hypothetical protein
MALARYTFASVVRHGFQATADAKAEISVQVSGQELYTRQVDMLNAGDVTGIPGAQLIRAWPADGSVNVEPNYLALVEYDSPDVPWLFSRPSGPDGRIHPWVCLAVIDETELSDPLSNSPLGTKISINVDQLPNPAEAWLWAHGQLLGGDTVPGDPSRSLSRLICPRRLLANRRYLAVVLPTLASTRIAGLGEDPGDQRTSTEWAWQTGQGVVTLPVFHWFRFSTGPSGDFEALVRRLKGVPLPAGMGRRRLRLGHPLSSMPDPEPADPETVGADLELHVALRPPGEQLDPVLPLVGQGYLDVLKSRLADAGYDISLLSQGPDADPPHVGPPVYGQLPVGTSATAAALGTGAVPPWLTQLNLDPRLRVAAGLGAQVVRNDQDHYLEVAWKQVGDVLAANRLRRRAEFSLAASRRLHSRWIAKVDAGALLTATAPVHAKIWVAPGETVVGRLRDSPVPPAVVSVELRRFARERGTLAKAAGWRASANVPMLAQRSAEATPLLQFCPLDTIDTVMAPSALWGLEEAAAVLARLVPGVQQPEASIAAANLDAITHAVAGDLAPPDQVAARLDAARPSADTLLSQAGFLPISVVTQLARPAGPPAPPAPPPEQPAGPAGPVIGGPIRRRVPRQPVEPVVRGPLARGPLVGRQVEVGRVAEGGPVLARAGGFGGFVRHQDEVAQLARFNAGIAQDQVSFASEVLRVEPTMIQRDGGRLRIDTASLYAAGRTGEAARTIDATSFEGMLSGHRVARAVTEESFGLAPATQDSVFAQFRDAAIDMAAKQVRGREAPAAPGRALAGGLDGLRGLVVGALDPRQTLIRAVNSRIGALLGDEALVFDDIMAAPDLSEPTYGALARISHDWLLPGIDTMPTDTTTLVAANREFIASFLVGMNHELARELLWHEYPTDQRGTYARQFWTRKVTANREDRYDLKQELHKAPQSTLSRLTGQGEDPLVLVVKGDLVRRYPGVIISAAHTRLGPSGKRLLDPDTVIEPDFVGLLAPDVLLVGFDALTEPIVRAVQDDPAKAYWFFFAEHFAEPRFGFDELVENNVELGPDEHRAWTTVGRTWNDAAWQYATLDARGFLTAASFTEALRKGTDDGSPEQHKWASDAASQAWIALQFPFRRGVPATQLLPEQGGQP